MNHSRVAPTFFLLLSALFASACSGTYKHDLHYNPGESLRVAVLPFVQKDSDGQIVEEDGSLLVDGIPLVSSEVADSPAAISRKLVYVELSRTALDVISPALIDLELPHRGFARADGTFELKKIHSVPPAAYCETFLDCDAVLYGTVLKWDRSYYGIESAHEIQLELRLVEAKSGKLLFKSVATERESRGLTKGPTGYSSLVVEPIRGLDSEIIEGLAQRTIQQMLDPLRLKIAATDTQQAPPPAIFAVSHDAMGGAVRAGSPLLVVAFGAESMTASFSLGDAVRGVPMLEQSPGHYLGEYWPLPGEEFSAQPVVVSLRDATGRETKLVVDAGPVAVRP
jgi:hypothetical protein